MENIHKICNYSAKEDFTKGHFFGTLVERKFAGRTVGRRGDILMKCTNCGAPLLDTDQFCSKCGAKVIRERKCPDCGTILRDGTKFCPKCGRRVEDGSDPEPVGGQTLDIPMDEIERNILSETAAEMRARPVPQRKPASEPAPQRKPASESAPQRKPASESAPQRKPASEPAPQRKPASGSAPQRKTPSESPKKKRVSPEPPPKKKRPVYREEVEDDWDEEDWDEDDDEEGGPDILTIMTVAVGCVLLLVVAVLAFHFYRQYAPKDYDKAAEELQEGGTDEEQDADGNGSNPEGQESKEDGNEAASLGTIVVISNVNVRDNPSTEGTNVLKVAKKGETYEYWGIVDDNWYQVLLEDGRTGYMYKDYVEIQE